MLECPCSNCIHRSFRPEKLYAGFIALRAMLVSKRSVGAMFRHPDLCPQKIVHEEMQ